jgi:hypothetical protein
MDEDELLAAVEGEVADDTAAKLVPVVVPVPLEGSFRSLFRLNEH